MRVKRLTQLAIWLSIAFVAGCTSSPTQKTHYYLLNSPSESSVERSALVTEPDFVLEQIRVPDYLMQPNLTIQQSNNQLHHATRHLWAESIPESVSKIIVDDLQRQGLKIHDHTESDLKVPRLYIQLTHFYPTDRSEVLLSGKYWVADPENKKILKGSHFQFKKQLEKNGYAHSVAKMEELLRELSALLFKEL